MKKNLHLLICMVLAVSMLLSLCVTGFATTADDATLSLELVEKTPAVGQKVSITVNANVADKVTDGKLTFAYGDTLEFVGVSAGNAWQKAPRLIANTATEGKLVLTFAAEKAAAKGGILTLSFRVVKEGTSLVALTGGYLSGIDASLLKSDVSFTVDCPSARFSDCIPTEWYHEAIDFALRSGLMNGMDEKTFRPLTDTTRAMVVTILYRMAGSPTVSGNSKFGDVSAHWARNAIVWAEKNGIAEGMSATRFGPDELVTREQLVAFLARYAKSCGVDITPKGDLSGYTDANEVLPYARDYMIWAVENNIIVGMDVGELRPKTNSNRAMLATIAMRLTALLEP